MVAISQIRLSNAQFSTSSALVAVFVGGTSGIGNITLGELARLRISMKAYVVGRKASEARFKTFVSELDLAPNVEFVWVEGEISLLAEVKRVCEYIRSVEDHVDLLFMTTGYAPFGGRENTSEGLDVSHALTFYSRFCFVQNLLPLLRASGRARVISVGFGGMESASAIDVGDLNLEKPNAFGPIVTQMQMGTMGTLALERFAEMEENESIVFIHSHPGIVRTGNLFRGWKTGSWGMWFAAVVMDPILMMVAYSFQESAERHVYQITSGTFGGTGPLVSGVEGTTTRGEKTGGLFLVSRKCDSVMNEKEMIKLRAKAQEAVWDKALEVTGPYT